MYNNLSTNYSSCVAQSSLQFVVCSLGGEREGPSTGHSSKRIWNIEHASTRIEGLMASRALSYDTGAHHAMADPWSLINHKIWKWSRQIFIGFF